MRFEIILGLLCATLMGGSCADFRRGRAADGAVPVDDPVFENDVYPILEVRCDDCHSQGKEAAASRFLLTKNAKADRAMVLALISPGDPDNSLLLQRGLGEQHSGGQRLTPGDPEEETIRSWIANLPFVPSCLLPGSSPAQASVAAQAPDQILLLVGRQGPVTDGIDQVLLVLVVAGQAAPHLRQEGFAGQHVLFGKGRGQLR